MKRGWHLRNRHFPVLWGVVTALLLTGCAGGPIARQVAQSLAMQVADKAVGHAIDKPIEPGKKTNQLLVGQGIDPYQAAFLRARLTVPHHPAPPDTPAAPAADPTLSAQPLVTPLTTLEVWGVVLGPEKQTMLENIRDMGIAPLPPEPQWEQWQLAEGGYPGAERPMLILVPPEIGRVKSGDLAVVEVGATEGLYVAKDKLTP